MKCSLDVLLPREVTDISKARINMGRVSSQHPAAAWHGEPRGLVLMSCINEVATACQTHHVTILHFCMLGVWHWSHQAKITHQQDCSF